MSRRPGPGASDQTEVRVKRAIANPIYFGEAYFAPTDPHWNELLPPFAHEMLRFVCAARPWPNMAGVVMLPPEFLKTTLLSQVYPLWLTMRARIFGQLLRGLLLSEEENMAQANLSVVKWHIEHNERLQTDFADSQGRPLLLPDPDMSVWREDSIVVARPGMVSRDATWQAKGLDSKGIQGRRLDVVIGDDVVTPRNAHSPAMRKSALDTMEITVESRVVPGGQILVAGNFNDAKDLLSSLAKRSRYALFKRPSMHVPGKPAQAPRESLLTSPEHAKLAWPSNWTRQRLMLEYKDRPNRFRRIHLLDPRADEGERLQVGWVQLVPPGEGEALLRYCKFIIGVDPAPGGDTEDLDYMNITVGALSQLHFDIVQSFNVRADTPRQVDLLGRIHDAFSSVGAGVFKIGGAKIAMDRYFRGSVEIKRPDLKRKLEEISVPEAEAAKEVRLEGLGPRAQSGWLRVWEGAWDRLTSDAPDQAEELSFHDEWREFPYGAHDDRLDGCDIACRTAEDFAQAGPVDFTVKVAEAA